jgi:outer membrane protein assembly factor BamB
LNEEETMVYPQERFHPLKSCACLVAACLLLCAPVNAAPSVSLSRKSGPPTSRILVSGSGFGPNVGVNIFFDTADEALVVTNGKGEFQDARIDAPRSARPGGHWVTALEANDSGAQKPFLVETDWSQFGFDVEGTRLNPYENVLNPGTVAGLQLKWKYTTGGFVASSPAVENGIVYIASNKLYALDARTGANRWSYPVSGASPAVANRVVYVGDDKLYALDAETGTELWEYSTRGRVYCPPTVADGTVYFGSDDHNLYALDAKTGALRWSYLTGGVMRSAPAVANGVVYAGSDDRNLYALDARTGTKLWSYTTDGEIFISAPAVQNGAVYVASCGVGKTVFALNASTGALMWSFPTNAGIQASFAVGAGVVYVASVDNYLYALNATTGGELWRYSGGFYTSSPAMANGVIYIGSASYGTVDAISSSTGTLLWSYATGTYFQYASPVVTDGLVYSGSDDGTIYVFGLLGSAQVKPDVASKPNFSTLRPDFSLKASEPVAIQSG